MSSSNSSPYCPQNLLCTEYLVLKPEEASFLDLVRLLGSNRKRDFIESPLELEDELARFRYRWLVFVSALLLKLLRVLKTPMARIGKWLDVWLNLVSNNGGLLKLVLNFIKGKVEMPGNEERDRLRSIIGNLDMRIDLDPKIKFNSHRYTASLSWMASKLSYENSTIIKTVVEDNWKMKLIGSYEFWNEFEETNSTHAFIARNVTEDTDMTVVAFRGTEPFDADNWCTDLDISWVGLPGVGRFHAGFMKALGLRKFGNLAGLPKEIDMDHTKPLLAYYSIRQVLRQISQENKDAKFIVTGHSLGGALAILFASLLTLHDEKQLLDKLEGVYTFGQPRVGDEQFGEFMKKKMETYNVRYCRYVYCNDIVPRLPYDDKTLLYKHFGPCLFFNSFYHGQEMEEEPNKNYFSLVWIIPKYLNAGWELIRGFILPYLIWGPDYREGWCERLFRVIGLLFPGLSAHGPQDYNNLTRLGRLFFPDHDEDQKLN